MGKYKATINIDRDVWDKFRARCDRENTTATAEITAFIEAFCLDKEYEEIDWNKTPKGVRTIKEYVMRELLEIMTQRYERDILKTDRQTDTKTDSETDAKDCFSDAEVAAREGVHPATINRYRTGKRKMPVELAARWKVCPDNDYKWVSLTRLDRKIDR